MSTSKILFICLVTLFAAALDARETAAPAALCTNAVVELNKRFITTKGLDSNGNIPEDSGLIVHTIHGPGTGAAELNMKQLNALPVDAARTCGAFMNMSPPVYLPWCGSNRNPLTHAWDDSSSWTYIRHDTLLHGAALQRPDEVVCDDTNNKKYGLIFSNAFMNEGDNLGCMYPLDGDTGKRVKMGCGISQNDDIDRSDAQGRCASGETLVEYLADFKNLLTDDGGRFASYAGSLICSLSKAQFDLWVEARQRIDLSRTAWPVNEFVLFDWDTYSTADLASKRFLVGIYFLSGCSGATDGNRQQAQAIADLYRKWSGVDVPVVNLSNSVMRAKGTTPFSCQ